MKKKEEKPKRSKEFVNSPFKGLKNFVPDQETHPPETTSAKAPPDPPVHQVGEDDSEVFLRYMEGVRKTDRGEDRKKREGEAREEKAGVREEEDRGLFLSSLNGMDVTFRDEIPDVEPLRPLATNRMRQLKSGAIRVDLELDLHGLTKEEALASLDRFVTGAYNRGQKAILVITGKGNNSPAEPVLQGAVASWLREAGKRMVAEFAPAPRRMGGSGAFIVFLKDRSKGAGTK